MKRQILSLILNYFVIIKIRETNVLQTDIIMITNAVIIMIRHSGLLQPFLCHPTLVSSRMKILNVSLTKLTSYIKKISKFSTPYPVVTRSQ